VGTEGMARVFALPDCVSQAAGGRPGTKYFELYECRGTRLVGGLGISPGRRMK